MKPLAKIALLFLLLGAGLYLFTWGPFRAYANPTRILALLETARGAWWLPPVFITAYALGGLVAFPGTVATLVGGALFGLWPGALYNWIAANLNALLGFAAARYLGRDVAMRITRGRLARFDDAIGRNGFRAILYMRLVPLFPFNGINIGAGLAKIGWRDYTLATTIGILPGCIIYTYFASALIAGSLSARRESLLHLVAASVLLVALSIIPIWLKKRRSRTMAK